MRGPTFDQSPQVPRAPLPGLRVAFAIATLLMGLFLGASATTLAAQIGPSPRLPDNPKVNLVTFARDAAGTSSPSPATVETPLPIITATPTVRLVDTTAARRASTSEGEPEPASGADRLIIPALGIDAPVGITTPCDHPIPDGIWYWPCAGTNNFYLLGHDWGVFHPVQVAYHSDLLAPGMLALHSDHDAVIHTYRLLWVERQPLETFGRGSAWAPTPGPVITLQTCDGLTDDYRIIVRFAPA